MQIVVPRVVWGIPEEVLLPKCELMVEDTRDAGQTRVLILASRGVKGWLEIERIREVLLFIMVNVGPHGYRLFFKFVDVSLSLIIAQERAESASLNLISDKAEHSCIELKHGGHLNVHHPHEIQELSEYGAPLFIPIVTVVVTVSPSELMSKTQPVLLYQLLEAADSAIPAI